MPYRIAKEFKFEAAHQLNNVPEGHQCSRLHGHSYRVIFYFESAHLDGDWVLDFNDLDGIKAYIDLNLDHRNLNEGFDFETTAENIAQRLYHIFDSIFPQLTKVRVWETAKCYAEYWADKAEEYSRLETKAYGDQIRYKMLDFDFLGEGNDN